MIKHISPFLVAALALGWLGKADADDRKISEKQAERSNEPVTLAVIGDAPYGAAQVVDFPNLVAHINLDPEVSRVVHVGDIKNGSTVCSDGHFALVASYFSTFQDPLVYTPGDNEWTDCHRTNNGKYDPLERLEALRALFYATPGVTLGGQQRPLHTQAGQAGFEDLPENQAWIRSRVVFSTLHVVGSRNGLVPWFTDDAADAFVDDPARRLAEVARRTEAALSWIDYSFDLAEAPRAKAVVLFMQADTWPGAQDDGFPEIHSAIAERSRKFKKPVLVVQGDTHIYRTDQPLTAGDDLHQITFSVPNLTRVVVQGETTSEWLKLTVDPTSKAVFSWQRVLR